MTTTESRACDVLVAFVDLLDSHPLVIDVEVAAEELARAGRALRDERKTGGTT